MDLIENSQNSMSWKLNRILYFLENYFPGYPFHHAKDLRYFELLLEEFHGLDIEEELKSYCAWVLDQPEDKKISYRCRFRSWLKTSVNFKSGNYYQIFR